jgi:hypothetical protein
MAVKENLLVEDFSQCFEQLRHYDLLFRSELQFGFAAVGAVLTAAGALLSHYGFTPLSLGVAACLLIFAAIAGIALPIGLGRNRHYFAVVARYVNCIRNFYLSAPPDGFTDDVGMYRRPDEPRLFNLSSGQTYQLILLNASLSVLFAAGIGCAIVAAELHSATEIYVPWKRSIVFGIAYLAALTFSVLAYWKRYDAKAKSATTGKG